MFNEAFEMPALWDSPLATFLTHALLVVPASVLVCWVFFLTERVSDSMDDPFDGEATDVPISALCRTIEIDMRQATGIGHPPAPPAPVGGVLN